MPWTTLIAFYTSLGSKSPVQMETGVDKWTHFKRHAFNEILSFILKSPCHKFTVLLLIWCHTRKKKNLESSCLLLYSPQPMYYSIWMFIRGSGFPLSPSFWWAGSPGWAGVTSPGSTCVPDWFLPLCHHTSPMLVLGRQTDLPMSCRLEESGCPGCFLLDS